jgi:hypothetical protein
MSDSQPQRGLRPPALNPSAVVATVESLLKRDEADLIFVAGNLALVALDLIEWPMAALALLLHAMARTRFEALKSVAEVGEEAE